MTPFEIRQFLAPLLPIAARWLRATAANYGAQGRLLSAPEILIAQAAGVQNPHNVRLATVSEMPFPTDSALQNAMDASGFWTQNAAGLTLETVILIRENHFSSALLAHELVHVAQYERLGIEAFLQLYFEQVLEVGYLNAPLELEARQLEKRFSPLR